MINPLKIISNILNIVLTVLFLCWFAVFCFRLGFTAHSNPFLYQLAVVIVGNKQTAKPACYREFGLNFGQCDSDNIKPPADNP
ncbi:hypothetical protein [Tolypothrix sp. VBCCA 56010]|uniref:hypothetical protein n=1 Tax=Tolypothrix sp. VBCCA 56010 TaxID=3137731 RepID=UPI003D7EC079